MRPPAVLTSLEEDLALMGLSDAKASVDVAAPDAVEPTVVPEAVIPEATELTAEEQELEERRNRIQIRVAGGKAKRVRTKRTSVDKKLANRKEYRAHKNIMKRNRKKTRNVRRKARRDKIRSRLKHESFETKVSKLLESVESAVVQIKADEAVTVSDSLKSFANLAIIAEMLSDAFEAMADNSDEFELSTFETVALREMAETYMATAEECADLAEALAAGKIVEGEEDLKDGFNAYVHSILEGLDAYSSLVEGDDEDDDEEDDDECDDCGEADDECECDGGK